MPDWVEGEDYKVLEDGKVQCLHCDKVLSGKAGLGPHLSACPSRKAEQDKAGTPATEPIEQEPEYVAEQKVVKDTLERYAVGKPAVIRILKTIQAHPTYLRNAYELRALITAHIPKRSGTVDLMVQEILREVNPSALPGFRSIQQGRAEQPLTETRLTEILNSRDDKRRKDDEIRDLRKEMEKLKEKGSSGSSNELWEERRKVLVLENKLAIRDAVSAAYHQGQSEKVGKTTIDVIDKGLDKINERAEDLMLRLSPPKFRLKNTRTQEQRREKAKQIESRLNKKEVLVEAENDLAVAFYRMMTPEEARAPEAGEDMTVAKYEQLLRQEPPGAESRE